jgi:hypothetical protein
VNVFGRLYSSVVKEAYGKITTAQPYACVFYVGERQAYAAGSWPRLSTSCVAEKMDAFREHGILPLPRVYIAEHAETGANLRFLETQPERPNLSVL